jgi:hypothetical protein
VVELILDQILGKGSLDGSGLPVGENTAIRSSYEGRGPMDEAGAPDIEITPEVIKAGADIGGVTSNFTPRVKSLNL